MDETTKNTSSSHTHHTMTFVSRYAGTNFNSACNLSSHNRNSGLYLADWELAVACRPGFTQGEKKVMLLSNETLTNWYVCYSIHYTVNSFIELGQYLLMLPGH